MTNIKVYDNPNFLSYDYAFSMQQFNPNEIVLLDEEVWVYWDNLLMFQFKNLQVQLELYGYNFDWYEVDGMYHVMVYINLKGEL